MSLISRVSLIKGAAFALITLALVAWDVVAARVWEAGPFQLRTLAEHLIELGVSLEALQVGVQRYIDPDLWDDYCVPLLLTPSLYVFGVMAVALLALGRLIRPRRSA